MIAARQCRRPHGAVRCRSYITSGGLDICPPLWSAFAPKGGYTLVTLPPIVTPYRDSVDETRDRVTYQKLVTR